MQLLVRDPWSGKSKMSEIKLSTTKVPVFNGSKKDFTMWWNKFQAYAGVKKIDKAINKSGEGLPARADDTIDGGTDDRKKTIKKIEQNTLAMHSFTLAFKNQKLMNMIWQGNRHHLHPQRYKRCGTIVVIRRKPVLVLVVKSLTLF